MSLSDSVAALEAERDVLFRRVTILDKKLVELSDLSHERELIRRAYRRGYLAGRAAVRRGASYTSAPERTARTWIRLALANGDDDA